MHPRNHPTLQLAFSLLFALHCPTATGANKDVSVGFALTSDFVYPGEAPRVRIVVTAPLGEAVDVVKADRAMVTGSLVCDIYRIDGTRLPGGLANDGVIPLEKEDYERLAPGGRQTIEETILSQPAVAGSYKVRIRFTPTPAFSEGLVKELKLECRDILPSQIVARHTLQKASDSGSWFQRQEFELLNVHSGTKHELVFRHLSQAHGIQMLTRLFDVDTDTRTASVMLPGSADPMRKEVWFTCNIADKIHVCHLNPVTGRLLGRRVLDLAEPSR